jgi:hypothetical protein
VSYHLLVGVLFALAPGGLSAQTTLLYKSRTSGRIDATRAVLSTPTAFERVWREAHANLRTIPELPAVDFEKEIVIVAAMGMQGGTGRDIAITRVRDRGNVTHVAVEVRTLDPKCESFPQIEFPTVMVRVPRTLSTVVFEDRVIEAHC